jgi:signal transduction histidine kinase/ActR/RegA family two-component response regulator
MSRQRFANPYMWSVVAAGAAALAASSYGLAHARPDLPLLILALMTVAASSTVALRIPNITGRITVSDTFIFLTMLLYGGGPAVILAAADGLCSSLRISRKPRTILFNSATMACSTVLTVTALRLCFGPPEGITRSGFSANFVGAICLMALVQYLTNSGLIAVEKSFKTGRPFWSTWRRFYLWTSVTYFAGASAAVIIAKLVVAFGFYAVVLTTPIIAIIYLTYQTYLKSIESSQAYAAEAERHVEELNHYITELKLAEEERARLLEREQQARREAEAASRLKDEFLATLSHELRTPLTSILGWANLLHNGALNEEARAQALETIVRNAQTQKRLIDDLLDVSRIISGKLRLDVRQTGLGPVIEDAIEVVRPAADARRINITYQGDPAVGPIPADPGRILQVVWNLLFNAVKFTPEGGRVDVRLERAGSRARVVVSDTGQGIRPEFLPHVFDRFRQADGATTRVYGGLGLGLAIVRHLVEAHGGTVKAESEGEGRGATFSVTLPILAVRMESAEGEPAARAPQSTGRGLATPRLSGVRVLVVDDDLGARQMISTVLAHSGAEVKSCVSCGEALDALCKWKPDVLMSDIGMPNEDGYDLIRRVRGLREECGGRTPAAALTAYARDEDRERALSEGYQVHVAKPVEPGELVAVVSSLAARAVRT